MIKSGRSDIEQFIMAVKREAALGLKPIERAMADLVEVQNETRLSRSAARKTRVLYDVAGYKCLVLRLP